MDAGTHMDQTVFGELLGDHSVFSTDYNYFVAAAIVEVCCVAVISVMYWGWWTLGRPVSFSPLEIAKAFQSPLLANYNSNSTGRDIARAAEDTSIQYGAKAGEPGDKKAILGFARPGEVDSPEEGASFA
jgi:hypothetical protein